MSSPNEEVLTATSGNGKTSFMVCKTNEENKSQKVCMDVKNQASPSPNQSMKKEGMLDNNTYDLIEQLTVENKSLWRIKNNYKKDSAKDNENQELWNFIEKDKEEIVKLLREKIRERL